MVTAKNSCANQLVWNVNNTAGIIQSSPGRYYAPNMDCHWNLSSNSILELAFLSFRIHQSDYVTVYDGDSTSAPLIGRFTGRSLPAPITAPITSSTNKLHIRITTDSSNTNDYGFIAHFQGTFCVRGRDI